MPGLPKIIRCGRITRNCMPCCVKNLLMKPLMFGLAMRAYGLKSRWKKRSSGEKSFTAELLQLYACHIVYQSIYQLPPPVLLVRPNCIQFPLSRDRRIHYELGLARNGVRLAIHFVGPWRKHAACMSELLQQNLRVTLIDNRAGPLGEICCLIKERENLKLIVDTAACWLKKPCLI